MIPDTNELRAIVAGRLAESEPMSLHTTLGVGGPADLYVEVSSETELTSLMRLFARNQTQWFLLGDGANLLVSDKGIRGAVIKLVGEFQEALIDGTHLRSGAAASVAAVADLAADHDLAGLEGVGTVPGTIGGAIAMNAGTHRGYIDEVVETVSIVTSEGESRVMTRDECGFAYRNSRFQDDESLIVTFVDFALRPGDGSEIRKHLQSVRSHRARTQPGGRTAGCFFKNPPAASAGKLIESAGAMGRRVGGAVVSDIHANFIVNESNATASELRELAEIVVALVREMHGVALEYEVRLVGEW